MRVSYTNSFVEIIKGDGIHDDTKGFHIQTVLLKYRGMMEKLFALFLKELNSLGLIAKEGKIIDASLVEVPKQGNSRSENKQIQKGETPESFNENTPQIPKGCRCPLDSEKQCQLLRL